MWARRELGIPSVKKLSKHIGKMMKMGKVHPSGSRSARGSSAAGGGVSAAPKAPGNWNNFSLQAQLW